WLKACSQVVVSSEFVAGDLRRFYPEWAHKTRVIRLGIPSVEHEPTQEQVESYRQRKALPERFVLVAGWVTEHKNQQVVFEAVAKLRDQGVRIPVFLVGPNADILNKKSLVKASDYAFRILQFCKQAGLRNGADYFSLGFVADFELECLYRCATVLVVPTLTEAGSFPAREAMRAGCPVAYSNIPAFQEEAGLLENNAWMFPAHDSCALAEIIREIANDPEKTRLRARAAQRLVNSVFCWRKTARGYFSIFEQLARTEQS
ncbi:MAG: glycosyltransferase, partial [Candidatus Korobacteraceae bacterium]